jgi:ubiquitin carboxyl-terminal hydrolase 35/38
MIARESVEDMEMMSLSDSNSRASLFPERGDKDLIGLNNMGNTCYMNSFLQVLNMTDQLRLELFDLDFQHIKSNKGYKFGPADSIAIYRNIQLLMSSLLLSKRRAITPASFLKSLPDWWRTGRQQDSGEFGRFLFDQLDNAVKLPLPAREDTKALEFTSAVNDVFGGTTKTLITCSKCGTVSARKESTIDLLLAFPPSNETPDGTLEELIQYNYDSAGEVLEGDNSYSCETCKEHTCAMKKTVLYVAPEEQAPKHLLITLNRFSYDYKTSTRSKLMTQVRNLFALSESNAHSRQVSYPEFLQVPVYYDGSESKLEKKHAVYVLYGVVMHAGQSAEYGHYYSYARHSYSTVLQCFESPLVVGDEPKLSATWYRFNDEVVDRSDLASFTQISKHFSNDVPYMLFYIRADHVPDQVSLNKLLSPELPHWLVEEIEKDNEKFSKERTNTTRAVNPWANKKYDWWQDPDKDNDNPPWKPGGGGFGGGFNAVF